MFKIGEFARLGGVSVRTLHHYDDLGLLRPAALSEGGYRLYAPAQLALLRRITALKGLGYSLDEIAALLGGTLPEPYPDFLARKREELLAQRDTLNARLAQLDAEIDKERRMTRYTVQLKPMPAVRALLARGPAPDYRHVTALMERLYEQVCAAMGDHTLPDPGWSVVTWRGGGYQSEEEIELEVAVPVFEDVPGPLRPGVTLGELPEQTVAATLHLGSYERFGEAYAALLGWMDREGYAPDGPVREVYLRFSEREEEQLSELQVPVRRA
ncbi:MerR family transcriptional regulator [Deinococcus planocerae]|uniref:MerR family transcriptional regulator n=1 Tax=Deinococcus planocerae TaxID=1737569 RepID=UPI000C7F3C94|nr:MerR family transcriptional regulator [Deinococcus planocerae]